MAARSYAKPVSGELGDALSGPTIAEVGVGYSCPRGATDAPRDVGAVTGAVSAVLAL